VVAPTCKISLSTFLATACMPDGIARGERLWAWKLATVSGPCCLQSSFRQGLFAPEYESAAVGLASRVRQSDDNVGQFRLSGPLREFLCCFDWICQLGLAKLQVHTSRTVDLPVGRQL
jgi:hypothetical protein